MQQLYFGGPILTMEEPLYAEAMLTEDGRICALGPLAQLRARAPKAQPVDLKGRTLMPAFLDAHGHLSQTASYQLQADLTGAETAEELERRIRAFIQERQIPPNGWVQARGYDHNLLPGRIHPTAAQLEAWGEGRAMVLQHASGHMGVFSATALELLGLTANTPDPQGGKIERKDGALTGYLEENAFFAAQKQVPPMKEDAMMQAFEEAQQVYAAHGITTVQEGMMVPQMLPMYTALTEKQRFWLDVVGYPTPDCWRLFREKLGGMDCVRVGGMKIFLDGSPQGRTAWMRTPYAGTPRERGYGVMTDEAVLAAMEQAAEQNCQLLAHCNGDAAADQYLRCMEQAQQRYPWLKALRPVMIHAQLLDLDQLAAVKCLGVTPSFFAAHVYHWGDTHIRNFGRARAARISPAASTLKAGIRFTFHQDPPVIRPDMLETVWCAVNRITREGEILGPEQAISPLEALRAVTIHAAWQYFEENRKGSLRAGKDADFIVLDQDPLAVPAEEIRSIRILATVKKGALLYRL